MNHEPKHFAYIDAVRGLAFLAVITFHTAGVVGAFSGKAFLQGSYGVQLFFLASAITLCNSMAVRQQEDRFPVLYFYLRRLFRIAPLFWCAMLFYWLFPAIMPSYWLGEWAPNGVHPSYFVLTALFLHGWNPFTFNSIVPGGWSIAVEMTFYLIFPFLFRLVNTPKKAALAVLFSIFYLKLLVHVGSHDPHSICDELRIHFFPGTPDFIWNFFAGLWFPSQLPVFLVGFLVYQLLKNGAIQTAMKSRFWANFLLFSCLLLLAGFFTQRGGFVPAFLLIVFALAGIIVSMSGGALRWLANRGICYIGKISYSCYLVHFAALGIVLRLLGIHLTDTARFFDAGKPALNFAWFLAIFAIALGLTVIIATATLHLIENPGISLGRKLIRRIAALSEARSPVVSPPASPLQRP